MSTKKKDGPRLGRPSKVVGEVRHPRSVQMSESELADFDELQELLGVESRGDLVSLLVRERLKRERKK